METPPLSNYRLSLAILAHLGSRSVAGLENIVDDTVQTLITDNRLEVDFKVMDVLIDIPLAPYKRQMGMMQRPPTV